MEFYSYKKKLDVKGQYRDKDAQKIIKPRKTYQFWTIEQNKKFSNWAGRTNDWNRRK